MESIVQCIHRKHCAMHTSKILCNAYSGALPEWEASGGSRVEIKIPHSSDFLTRLTLQQPPHHPTLGRTHFIAKHSHLLVLMFFMFYNSAWGNISSCLFQILLLLFSPSNHIIGENILHCNTICIFFFFFPILYISHFHTLIPPVWGEFKWPNIKRSSQRSGDNAGSMWLWVGEPIKDTRISKNTNYKF